MSEIPTYLSGPLREANNKIVDATLLLDKNDPELDEQALEIAEEAESILYESVSKEFGSNDEAPVASLIPEDERYHGLNDAIEMMDQYDGDLSMDSTGRSIVKDRLQDAADYLSELEKEAREYGNLSL